MTTINKKELLTALQLIEPAVGRENFLKMFAYCKFDDTSVTGTNGSLTVQAELPDVGVTGALRFDQLFSNLNTATGDAVDIDQKGNGEEVDIKVGRHSITMPILPTDQFVTEEANDDEATKLYIDDTLAEVIDRALMCAGNDSARPVMMGVALEGDEGLTVYATDGSTLSMEAYEPDGEGWPTTLIPTEFIRAYQNALDITGETYPITVLVTDRSLKTTIGGNVITTTLSVPDKPMDYATVVEKTLGGEEQHYFSVPAELQECLQIAAINSDGQFNGSTTLDIAKGKLSINAKSDRGSAENDIVLEKGYPKKHAIDTVVNTELLLRILSLGETMCVMDNVTIVASESGYMCLCANQ
jgi:DNA polymerase III sliding clamp (beta) subunit (PCNA family)